MKLLVVEDEKLMVNFFTKGLPKKWCADRFAIVLCEGCQQGKAGPVAPVVRKIGDLIRADDSGSFGGAPVRWVGSGFDLTEIVPTWGAAATVGRENESCELQNSERHCIGEAGGADVPDPRVPMPISMAVFFGKTTSFPRAMK